MPCVRKMGGHKYRGGRPRFKIFDTNDFCHQDIWDQMFDFNIFIIKTFDYNNNWWQEYLICFLVFQTSVAGHLMPVWIIRHLLPNIWCPFEFSDIRCQTFEANLKYLGSLMMENSGNWQRNLTKQTIFPGTCPPDLILFAVPPAWNPDKYFRMSDLWWSLSENHVLVPVIWRRKGLISLN